MRQMLSGKAAFVVMIALLIVDAAAALPFERGQRDFTVVTGYGENHRFPSAMKTRIKFGQTSLRWGKFTSPTTAKAFEVTYGKQVNGTENQFISAVMSHRHYFVVRKNAALGYELAFGGLCFQQPITGQATRLNFTEQVGLVLQYKAGADSALSLQYRFCHISNAGISKPNVGVNASVLSVGYTWFK